MDWQQPVALGLVVAAGFGLVASKFRRRKFSFERDTHCGCSSPSHADTSGTQAGPKSSIIYRARKGERPEVVVKMR